MRRHKSPHPEDDHALRHAHQHGLKRAARLLKLTSFRIAKLRPVHYYLSGGSPVKYKKNKNNKVYVIATVATMIVFVPFRSHAWSLYAAACAGYSILVFGLRRIKQNSVGVSPENAKPESGVILTHLTFLAIVCGWIWLCVVLIPYLPYFLTTEDTSRPYFGLAFIGIIGLLGIEAVERRWLNPNAGNTVDSKETSQSSVTKGN